MFAAKLTRIESNYDSSLHRRTINGYIWASPEQGTSFILYQKVEQESIGFPKDGKYIPDAYTTQVREVTKAGEKTCYFKTVNSLYKLEILDENYKFKGPFNLVPVMD